MSSKSKYKPVTQFLDLEFVDFPGLEVRTRSASIGEIKRAQELNVDVNEKDPDKQLEAFRFFERKLIEWNLVHPEIDDGSDVCAICGLKEDDELPPTIAGMLCLDIAIMLAIIFGWVRSVATVALPKGMSLPNGGKDIPEELRQKLETLQSLGTSPMPN
jgi:hypothetical protein